MNLITIFAFISAVLGIYCVVPYIKSVLNRKTKPHQLSWLVFTIMGFIAFFSQYFEGGTYSIVIALIFSINCLLIFILSLRYGVTNSSSYDKTLFAFALFTLVVWYFTKSNALAIWLSVIIDVCATTMTVLKIKAHPYSEEPFPWFIATIAYIFTLITLIGKPFGILYIRPIYGFLSEGIVFGSVYLAQSFTASPKKR